jgi:hypothetical protein
MSDYFFPISAFLLAAVTNVEQFYDAYVLIDRLGNEENQ